MHYEVHYPVKDRVGGKSVDRTVAAGLEGKPYQFASREAAKDWLRQLFLGRKLPHYRIIEL